MLDSAPSTTNTIGRHSRRDRGAAFIEVSIVLVLTHVSYRLRGQRRGAESSAATSFPFRPSRAVFLAIRVSDTPCIIANSHLSIPDCPSFPGAKMPISVRLAVLWPLAS
jgi:hypothetical protein